MITAHPQKPSWPPKLVALVFALAWLQEIMVKCCSITPAGQAGVPVKKDEVDLKIRASRQLALERRDLDSMVDRELKERFADYTYIDTDVRQVNQETMRQELRREKKQGLVGQQKIVDHLLGKFPLQMDEGEQPRIFAQSQDCKRGSGRRTHGWFGKRPAAATLV